MTLVPLLDSSEDELERALLLSVQSDAPGPAGLRDTALALGLAAPTAKALAAGLVAPPSLSHALSAKAAGAASTLGAANVTGAATSFGAASALTAGKFLLGGALMSFVAMTALDQAFSPSSAPPPVTRAAARAPAAANAASPLAAVASPAPVVAEPVVTEPAHAPESARHGARTLKRQPVSLGARLAELPEPAPEAVAGAVSPAVSAPASAPAPATALSPSASLAAEIRLLDRTRSALAAGNAVAARHLLQTYAASKPSGVLSQEADLLRVQLLLTLGDRRAAAELARRIIRQYPGSTHVDSLRSLAEEP